MVTWRVVQDLALALPGAEASTSYRLPAFKVGGKMFAAQSPHEDGALVVWLDLADRPRLLRARPEVYYVTPHYEPHPLLLVRWAIAARADLTERLEESWLIVSSRRPPPTRARRTSVPARTAARRRPRQRRREPPQ